VKCCIGNEHTEGVRQGGDIPVNGSRLRLQLGGSKDLGVGWDEVMLLLTLADRGRFSQLPAVC
jgi:hypothetical protein